MMFSAIRSRMTYANVVATLALVFAMSGGALAASHYLITSTKQIKPSVLASLKGKNGVNGAQGAQGVQGPAGLAGSPGAAGGRGETGTAGTNGTDGTNGENGKAGKNGKSVTVASESPGANCKEGGSSLEEEGTGTVTYACNGEKGAKGEEGNIKATLPSGSTETGAWRLPYGMAGLKEVPAISFPIPLPHSLSVSECSTDAPTCHFHLIKKEETGTGGCEGGTVAAPSAKPGNFCLYVGISENLDENEGEFVVENPGTGEGVGTTGVLLKLVLTGEGEGEAQGTWAVTAE